MYYSIDFPMRNFVETAFRGVQSTVINSSEKCFEVCVQREEYDFAVLNHENAEVVYFVCYQNSKQFYQQLKFSSLLDKIYTNF